MAYTPISNTVPQYSALASGTSAAGYYLKFYADGTTTPISMATDSAGGTLLAKCELDSLGYPTTDGTAIFIPHIDQTYKLALYTNAADADANTLASAAWVVDDLDPAVTLSSGADNTKNYDTIANAIADADLKQSDVITIGDRGGSTWDVVLSSTVTENTFNIVQCTGVATLSLELRPFKENTYRSSSLGMIANNIYDNTAAGQSILDQGFNLHLDGSGYYKTTGDGWKFTTTQQSITGDGFSSGVNYTGTGTAIDYDGWAGCSVINFLLYSIYGNIGVRVGPNSGRTRYAHWWYAERMMIIGTTPNWASTALGSAIGGFAEGGFSVEQSYYGGATNVEVSWCPKGFVGFYEHNGNTYTACVARANDRNTVWDETGNASSGSYWQGGEIEGVETSCIELYRAQSMTFSNVRLEMSGSGTHIIVNPASGQTCNFVTMDNVHIEGPAKAYEIGNGAGAVTSFEIRSGRSVGSWILGSNCTAFRYSGADATRHGALSIGAGLLTDNGVRTNIEYNGNLSLTLGITGLTTTPTASTLFEKTGSIVTLELPSLTGTSNTTACTLTGLPAEIRPTSAKFAMCRVQDNGLITPGLAEIETDGTITLWPDMYGSTAFTASGSKGVYSTQISYSVK